MSRSICGTQCAEDKFMCHNGALDQGRVDPAQSGNIVGAISRSCFEWTSGFRQQAVYLRVSPVKGSRSSKGLINCPEDERKHHTEGPVEAYDRLSGCTRVLGYSGSNPRMGKLKKQRPSSGQKYDRFSVNAPRHRSWTEYARERRYRASGDQFELFFKLRVTNRTKVVVQRQIKPGSNHSDSFGEIIAERDLPLARGTAAN
jgi:hypothetical protein